MRYFHFYLFLPLIFLASYSNAQVSRPYSASEIQQGLDKLNVLGSVLYVAAHPDDENTQIISYFSKGKNYRTAYLSATRGDGGQNLIGPEIQEELGLIRTQELLGARRIDGGAQFFSRASDFGYSKHPDETFEKWEKEKILSDFVWVFRKFRPDVIITRFSTEPGITHGHHTASAILAQEAFELSGDPNAFSDQLKYVDPWQPAKIFWNTSWWFFRGRNESLDTTGLSKVDVGGYNPLLGKSYTEISAKSRSMHKSQGFGASGSRGSEFEYLVRNDTVGKGMNIFDGINTTWSRVDGGEQVALFLRDAVANYDPNQPYEIIEELLLARRELLKLPDQFWKEIKLQEISDLIMAASGTFIELTASEESYVAGDSILISAELINRSPVNLSMTSVDFSLWEKSYLFDLKLRDNQVNRVNFQMKLPDDLSITQPYWLVEDRSLGMFNVSNQRLIGEPEDGPPISCRVTLKVGEDFIDYTLPVSYKETDPVEGEVYKPIQVTPPVMINSSKDVMVFADNEQKDVAIRVTAGKKNIEGDLYLELPDGWRTFPEKHTYKLADKGEERNYAFSIYPSDDAGQYEIQVKASLDGRVYDRGRNVIDYAHIPKQTTYPVSRIKVSRLDIQRSGSEIGYIDGAGDNIPQCLELLGYRVTKLEKEDVNINKLAQFDAIILGIRAFNTVDWLSYKNEILFDYVKRGGTVVVQYNTTRQLITQDIAPFPLRLSRNRVTVEESPVKVLKPKHPVLNSPNKIVPEDFEGWIQERGLYFADKWSDELDPIFQMNDPGEENLEGGLLVGKYGKGYYIYTGLSFFRELPAGVPGAYRLFTNLISLGNSKQQ